MTGMERIRRSLARAIVEEAFGSLPERRDAGLAHPLSDGLSPQDVFHDAALKFLDQQLSINRELDARTAQSFQVGSTVVTIAFGLLTLNKTQTHIPSHAKWALYGALGCYGLVLVFAF